MSTVAPADPTAPPAANTSKAARRAQRAASGRLGPWRLLFLLVLGVYFFVPLLAMARFAFQRWAVPVLTWDKVFDGWSLGSIGDAFREPNTIPAARTTVLLAIATIAFTIVLLLPVSIFVEIKARQLRPVLLVLTLAPWVVPPIALVVGVAGTFRSAVPWFLGSIWCLVPFYTLWALPFAYRSIDGGLRAIDVRTLYEAARSIGVPVHTFVLRIVLPNMVSSMIVVAALTAALVGGEFAFASLLLKNTLPTQLLLLNRADPRGSLALALLIMLVTTAIIGASAALLRRRGVSFNAAGI